MKLEERKAEVAAVQLALSVLHYQQLEVRPTVQSSIWYLKQQYDQTQDDRYLHAAIPIIQAFLNLGYVYEMEQELFDEIVQELHEKRHSLFPKTIYSEKRIRLTRSQVREMIGRWKPSQENPMKIADVVDDIIKKVSQHEEGHYYYSYKRSAIRAQEEPDLYELVITKEESFFHDFKNQKYYTFQEE